MSYQKLILGLADPLQAAEASSKIAVQLQEDRAAFQEKLAAFLKNNVKNLHLVSERICEAEHKLSEVKEQFEEANQGYLMRF